MSFTSAQEWIVQHKELVTFILVPIVTLLVTTIVTFITSWRNLVSQREDRDLQKLLKENEKQQAKIEELRQLFIQFEHLAFFTKMDLDGGLSTGTPKTLSAERVQEISKELTGLFVKIHFIVAGFSDPEGEKLDAAMRVSLTGASNEQERRTEVSDNFPQLASRILLRLEAKNSLAEGTSSKNA